MAEKEAVKGTVVQHKMANWDSLGGEKIEFSIPLASFKDFPDNIVIGKLVQKVALPKPDGEVGTWDVYRILLDEACKAQENDEVIWADKGRLIQIPAGEGTRELDQHLMHPDEIVTVAIRFKGMKKFKGGREMVVIEAKHLGTSKRLGAFRVPAFVGTKSRALGAGTDTNGAALPAAPASSPAVAQA